MKKNKYQIKSFDSIILFWATILIIGSITTSSTPIIVRVTFIISGVCLLVYLAYVIKIRADLTFELSREREISEEIESKIQESEDNPYRKIKQQYLEDGVETVLTKLYVNARFIRNVYIPSLNSKRAEIDLLMIHTSGIYMFEAKNRSAQISGNWAEEILKAEYKSGKVHDFPNPILQNSYHFEYLKSVLGVNETGLIKNIVVFGDQANFNQDELQRTKPPYANVFKLKDLEKQIANLVNRSKVNRDQTWVDSTYQNIKANTNVTKEEKEMHINQIKDSRKKS